MVVPERRSLSSSSRLGGDGQRRFVTVMVVGLLGTMLLESASARTPTVRRDPNDSDDPHDIRKVVTDITSTHAVLRIGLWEPARPWGGGQIIVWMDTHGTRRLDRYVTFQRRRCSVQEFKAGDYRYIGHRYVQLRGERSIGCKLPLGWFDIDKTVRFWVFLGGLTDEAPNWKRYYVGL
jgi:hypothetical protein